MILSRLVYSLISLLTRALAIKTSLFKKSKLTMAHELPYPHICFSIHFDRKNSVRTDQGDNIMATHSDSRSTFPQSVRRWFLQRVSRASAILATAMLLGGVPLLADDQPQPAWEMIKTVSLDGLEVSLSKPRLVARSQRYLWFPTMTRLSGGELFATFSTNLDAIVADRTSSVSWSADDGLTWSEPSSIMPAGDLYAETMLRLKNGDEMLLPFNLYPDGEAMRGWHQIVSGKKGERKVTFTDKSITVSGWPRPDRSFNEKLGLSGFGFNGHGITGMSGEYLATMYGFFKDERRYSLVMVESTDGLAWKFRSLIAGFDCPLAGGEGPCESQTVRLKDGRLMNTFRLASNVPYGQTFSDDDGKTWSAPVAMQDAHSVQPSVAQMGDGSLVLSGGRPGIFAWINRSGDGKEWLPVDLQSHHNENHPQDAIMRSDQTTSYTEVVALDEHSVIVMYDRIPHGWSAIPENASDTNSIWVVMLTWKAN